MENQGENNQNLIYLDADFWNQRWAKSLIGWDIGYVSPPIENYIDGITDKEINILIPGCGNAYEAEYLLLKGFKKITIIDIASKAVEILKEKFHDTDVKVICEDFFQHQEKYDLIIEQTFFCAIHPNDRMNYVKKVHDLLNKNGRLVGLLFNRDFNRNGPPFGGNKEEYRRLFQNNFNLKTLAPAYNSIPARQGSEVFINFIKKC